MPESIFSTEKANMPKQPFLKLFFSWRKDAASDYLIIVLRRKMRFIFDRKEKNSFSAIVIKTCQNEF